MTVVRLLVLSYYRKLKVEQNIAYTYNFIKTIKFVLNLNYSFMNYEYNINTEVNFNRNNKKYLN